MAKHDVSLKLPVVPIAEEADAVFKIEIDGMTFGALTVRANSLVWRPSSTTPGGIEVTWTAFDEWMQARNNFETELGKYENENQLSLDGIWFGQQATTGE